jgi:phosphoribosyl-dephospho-CoA transferase
MPRSTPADGRAAAPHDLLRVPSASALSCAGPLPAWAAASLARAPWVVVRRARGTGELLPVGVRGRGRGDRLAAWLPAGAPLERLRPEELGARAAGRDRGCPQLVALRAVRSLLRGLPLAWGPVGSVGFQLATGARCVSPGSDLDLLVRAPVELPRREARRLLRALSSLPVRVDVQLETPLGGLALAEWAAGPPRVALRTADGPRLVERPWDPAGPRP